MSDCEWGCDLVCVHCGYVARKPNTRRNCSVDHPPSLTHQLGGYALAVSRWLGAGRPVRTDSEVAGLLMICQQNRCGKYRDGQCLACGCRVNSSGWAVVNKLRMATESCPKGMWDVPEIAFGNIGNLERLRVGFVTPNLYVGGVESWLASLVGEWKRTGAVEVAGIAHTGPGGTVDPITSGKLSAMCPVVSSAEFAGGHLVRSPLEAIAAVAAASDVLIVWSVSRDLLARVKRPGLLVVGVSHGCHDWWMKDAAQLVDRWVAVSAAAVAPIPVAAPEVEIIPNGIDLERCGSILSKQAAREQIGLPIASKVAGYVGRLSPEKRIREIVAAADLLPKGWLLLCVGDGKERSAVTGERIHHLQSTDAIGDVWRACDVAVVASEAEGYCLAAVEALAAGVPLASTAVGIVPSIPGVELIDQPAEPGEIARAIVAAERRGVSGECREWVTREASSAVMAERWQKWLVDARTADFLRPSTVHRLD